MATVAGNDETEGNQNTVFIDTSLDTHLVTMVSDSDTVSDFKNRIMLEHHQCFPAIGDIKIECLKVKRRGTFYRLSDSMLVKRAFAATKKNWFISVDAFCLEQDGGFQHLDEHKAGDQLALPLVTVADSRAIDRRDNHADRPSNLALDQGSPSFHHKIVPFANQHVSNVNMLSGDFCKNVSKKIEEERSSNDKQLDSEIQEKVHTVNKEIKSKKRARDVHNESLLANDSGSGSSVRKRKIRRVKNIVKASEENMVLTYDSNEVKDKEASINDESCSEQKPKGKDWSDEDTRINKGESLSNLDQVTTAVLSGVKDVGKETLLQNTEACETVADVAMVLEKNIQQETPFGISEIENNNELVEKAIVDNEIPSLTRTSDFQHGAPGLTSLSHLKGSKSSTKHKASKKATSGIKKLHNINKNAVESSLQPGSTVQECPGDQISKHKEDNEVLLKQEPEVKHYNRKNETLSIENTTEVKARRTKKSAVKKKDELLVKHAAENLVGDISSLNFAAPGFCDRNIDERNEVSEKSLLDANKGDDVIVKEVEIPKPTEVHVENVHVKSRNTLGNTKKRKGVERSASRKTEKQTDDAATVTNEEKVLPQSEREQSLRSGENTSQVDPGKENEDMDDTQKKKRKTKKKSSAKRNENDSIRKHAASGDVSVPTAVSGSPLDGHLDENANKVGERSLPDANRIDGDNFKGKDAQNFDESLVEIVAKNTDSKNKKSSVITPQNLPSGHQSAEFELEQDKSKNTETVTMSEVSKNRIEGRDDVYNKPKDGSHEIDFMDYFEPSRQPNKVAAVDTTQSGKEKKPKGKTKDSPLVQASPNASVQSQKFISKAKTNSSKVSTDLVKEPNMGQLKTPKGTRKIDAKKGDGGASEESSSSSENFGRSFLTQKSYKQRSVLGQTHVKTLKKSSAGVVNHATQGKSLLSAPGTIFGDDSSADDNASVDSDSSTHTPSRKSSSSSGESDSSIRSRRNGSHAMKRNEGGGKNSINTQSKLKDRSIADLLRSSSRFKKAKFSASQQVEDTESQPIDFVPDSQPMAKR